jgi:hypothetical protein
MGVVASHGFARPGAEALRALRSMRRQRFVEEFDVMDALYKIYLVAIFGGVGLALIAGAIADAPLGPAELDRLTDHGPAVLGVAVALAVFLGLRSGARGGPLAIEAAELQYVLLAPVDRGAALRPAALRQARVAVLTGAVLGLAVGAFAVPRLPGSSVEWLAVLTAFGALLPLCCLGSALLACGHRLGPRLATLIGLLLSAWALADLFAGTVSSPATMLGALATLPLQSGVTVILAAVGAAAAIAAASAGLAGVGGLSLDLARRRATLVAELRFSAAVQDLRTVILLRRQLAAERPRASPWLSPAWLGRVAPVPRRALRGLLRWPSARLVRVAAAGVLTGLTVAAFWDGTTPLVAVLGVFLLIAALDVSEPLAQEVDHSTRRDLLPVAAVRLLQRHLAVPSLAMGVIGALAVLTVFTLGASGPLFAAGAVMVLPLGLLLVCCAAMSITNDPYRYILTPELGYLQTAAPIVIALVAVGGPALAVREVVHHGRAPWGIAVAADVVLLVLGVGLAGFVSGRVVTSQRASA